jgi:PAS domain S-box-containing protein
MSKILVVDNDPFFLNFMEDLLSKAGHEVTTTRYGLSALDILRTHTPEVIFVDLVMPNLDGRKLCKSIGQIERLKGSCVIILSAVAAEESVNLDDLGADVCIAKGPFHDMAGNILESLDWCQRRSEKRRGSPKVMGIENIRPREITKELLSVKRHFELILHQMSEGIMELTSEGRIVYANPLALSLTPLAEHQMLGVHFPDLFQKRAQPRISELLEQVRRTGRVEIADRTMTLGSYEVEVSLIPVKEEQFSGIIAILNDVTGRIRAEQNLRDSAERYRTLVEESFDGIFIQKGTQIAFVNQRLNEMLGYRDGELLGREHWEVYHPHYQGVTRERAQARLRGEAVTQRYEVKLQRKDGSSFYGEILAKAIDVEGEPGIQVWVRDITERKGAEEALKQSEQRYRLVVENALVGHYVFELSTGRLLFVNQRFCEMFGYSLDDVRSLSVWDVLGREENDVMRSRLTGDPQEENPSAPTNKYTATRKDGTRMRVEVNEAPVTWETVAAVQGLVMDVTETEALEMQLRHAQKMEAVGTLAGGVAHDFNNLLMGIQGNASLMLLDTDAAHPHHDKLKNIEAYVKSGAELTRQLLGFASAGKYEVKTTDLNKLIDGSARMFGRTKKEITIHKRYQEAIWAVEVDQTQIEQVLLNLYVNAWQAMPSGGELFLSTENVELADSQARPYGLEPGRYVKIDVTDTGVGMDPDTQHRIFDPFFTTKEMGRGTGLGLASAYGIIKNHKGVIVVFSETGRGSSFVIYLPASDREVSPETGSSEAAPMGEGTVLLVDDEEMILDVGRQMLERLGYEVLVARSGIEALTVFKEHIDQIDLVILDLIMPDMGGGESFDRLREMDPDVKVLLSSGYSENGQAKEILKRGCRGFIQKPFDLNNLAMKVQEVLAKGPDLGGSA